MRSASRGSCFLDLSCCTFKFRQTRRWHHARHCRERLVRLATSIIVPFKQIARSPCDFSLERCIPCCLHPRRNNGWILGWRRNLYLHILVGVNLIAIGVHSVNIWAWSRRIFLFRVGILGSSSLFQLLQMFCTSRVTFAPGSSLFQLVRATITKIRRTFRFRLRRRRLLVHDHPRSTNVPLRSSSALQLPSSLIHIISRTVL